MVEYNIDTFKVWAMKLSRAGYGDINTIRNLNAQEFLDLIHYENYLAKYAELVRVLNTKRGK